MVVASTSGKERERIDKSDEITLQRAHYCRCSHRRRRWNHADGCVCMVLEVCVNKMLLMGKRFECYSPIGTPQVTRRASHFSKVTATSLC